MLKGLESYLRRGLALATASQRRLPDFVIIGAQKAGTTSLYEWIAAHPDVTPPLRKEIHFFDQDYARGPLYYRAYFPRTKDARPGELTGEATPYYLFHPSVPARVKALMPNVKLIALLRDPIDRAYSHYNFSRRLGHETLDMAGALLREPTVVPPELPRIEADPAYVSFAHTHFSYVSRGLYADQLERWFGCFDRSQVLIERAEDMFADPAAVFERVTQFLGLSQYRPQAFEKHNVGLGGEPTPPEIRALFGDTFTEPNARLERLLGRTMGW